MSRSIARARAGRVRYQEITDEHAAGENSECRAHDNLNPIPLAASTGEKTAA
jgi:hypothetical protein